MSPKYSSLTVSLTAAGLLALASLQGAGGAPDDPAPGSTPAAAPTQSVLLLYNGRVLFGQLSQEDSVYVLKQRLGVIRFPKRDVERIFGSLEAVYQYKLSQLPRNDSDERMKLAKWCLEMKMEAAAKAQLEGVLEMSPDHPQAKAMLASLEAAAERARGRDAQVVQVSGEAAAAGRPGELNPEELHRSRSGPRAAVLGLPVIFDLPPALAVRRSQDFARYVHPELQKHCAKCHNERSSSNFQLIEARTRRDLNDEMIIRTNLEATLKLVDPMNLPQSPLLTNSLMPHKPNNIAILPSPKSQAYRYFATWVFSLQTTARPAEAAQATFSASGGGGGGGGGQAGGFASDRLTATPGAPVPPSQTQPGSPSYLPALPSTLPAAPSPGSPALPNPYAASGYLPAGSLADPQALAAGVANSLSGAGIAPNGARPDLSNAAGTGNPAVAGTDPAAAAAARSTSPAGAPVGTDAEAAKKRKKRELDPSVLEKFLMNRNQR